MTNRFLRCHVFLFFSINVYKDSWDQYALTVLRYAWISSRSHCRWVIDLRNINLIFRWRTEPVVRARQSYCSDHFMTTLPDGDPQSSYRKLLGANLFVPKQPATSLLRELLRIHRHWRKSSSSFLITLSWSLTLLLCIISDSTWRDKGKLSKLIKDVM